MGIRSTSFSVVVRNGRISDILRIYMDELLMVPFLFSPVEMRGGGTTHIPVASSVVAIFNLQGTNEYYSCRCTSWDDIREIIT